MLLEKNIESKLQVSIIASLAVNFPVIKDWGMAPNKLIWMMTANGKAPCVKTILCPKHVISLSTYDGQKTIMKALKETFSAPVILNYKTSKENRYIEIVNSAILDGENNALPIIISDKLPLLPSVDSFLVSMPEISLDFSVDWDDIVLNNAELSLVKDLVNQEIKNTQNDMEMSLIAAACFLYPIYPKDKRRHMLKIMLQVVKNMISEDDESRDLNGVSDIFVESINNWVRNGLVKRANELPYLERNMEKEWDEAIFYDSEYIYFSAEMFGEIVRKDLKIFPENIIKKELLEKGIISATEAGTCTSKMNYRDGDGAYRRKRMIRCIRDKLHIPGEFEIIEYLKIKEN